MKRMLFLIAFLSAAMLSSAMGLISMQLYDITDLFAPHDFGTYCISNMNYLDYTELDNYIQKRSALNQNAYGPLIISINISCNCSIIDLEKVFKHIVLLFNDCRDDDRDVLICFYFRKGITDPCYIPPPPNRKVLK